MPERKSMRRIKECLRLHYEARLSQNAISKALSIARSTVGDHLDRFTRSGKSWIEISSFSDDELEVLLFASPQPTTSRVVPDWEYVHKELESKSYVTQQTLWQEYLELHPDGFSYSRFSVLYREWARNRKVYMRQRHIGGEKLFVDYSGKRPCIRDTATGEDRPVELLVMAWGASQYIYAEAHLSQKLPDWIMGHCRGYEYFGCAPHIEIPDNLKSAVSKACRYDPDLNRTFTEFAEHYGVAIVPARPAKPKDKATVENAVLIAQRWILACLRHRVFYSLAELNKAIRELLDKLNDKPMQKYHQSRRQRFVELDKPNALPLPADPFEYREWRFLTLGFDYHIEIDKNYYSAPWMLVGQKLGVRVMEKSVEILKGCDRVAIHTKSWGKYQYSTVPDHMPPAHQKHLQWDPIRLYNWAQKVGPATYELVQKIIKTKFHPQQGFRPAVGILNLGKSFGDDRLESAARIALSFGFFRTGQIADLLKNGRDKMETQCPTLTVANTATIRGRDYYAFDAQGVSQAAAS
jgi:transposase